MLRVLLSRMPPNGSSTKKKGQVPVRRGRRPFPAAPKREMTKKHHHAIHTGGDLKNGSGISPYILASTAGTAVLRKMTEMKIMKMMKSSTTMKRRGA